LKAGITSETVRLRNMGAAKDTIGRMQTSVLALRLCLLVPVLPLAAAQAEVPVPSQPLQVAIVGASVSAGFVDGPLSGGTTENSTVPLQRLVREWLAAREARVTSRADALMFQDAATKGRAQVERTVKAGPDLVIALDFLFWFGYGRVRGDEQQARLERLQQGLDLLARIECPVVVGDLPDMAGASARMISTAQIPAPEILARCNERVRSWARERPRVLLFEVAAMAARMKDRGVELPLRGGDVATPPGALLQGDRLHANRLGMAYLGWRLQDALRRQPGGQWPELPLWTLEQFVAAAGAEGDLAELQAGAGK
jgi:hypothetical protein